MHSFNDSSIFRACSKHPVVLLNLHCTFSLSLVNRTLSIPPCFSLDQYNSSNHLWVKLTNTIISFYLGSVSSYLKNSSALLCHQILDMLSFYLLHPLLFSLLSRLLLSQQSFLFQSLPKLFFLLLSLQLKFSLVHLLKFKCFFLALYSSRQFFL